MWRCWPAEATATRHCAPEFNTVGAGEVQARPHTCGRYAQAFTRVALRGHGMEESTHRHRARGPGLSAGCSNDGDDGACGDAACRGRRGRRRELLALLSVNAGGAPAAGKAAGRRRRRSGRGGVLVRTRQPRVRAGREQSPPTRGSGARREGRDERQGASRARLRAAGRETLDLCADAMLPGAAFVRLCGRVALAATSCAVESFVRVVVVEGGARPIRQSLLWSCRFDT